MLKKLSLVLSVLAALGFAVAISTPADAKQQQQSNKSSSHHQIGQQDQRASEHPHEFPHE